METTVGLLRNLHAVVGFIALAAFWIPLLSRKGGARHRLYGRIFELAAYFVLASAAVSVVHRLDVLLFDEDRPAGDAAVSFMLFLGYLTLTTYATLRHAVGVLRTKDDPARLATPLNFALAFASIAASVALVAYAVVAAPPTRVLLLALSPIGLGVGYGNLRYLRARTHPPRAWLYEHLGGMIGAGIAFHTAFAVFGSLQLFDLGLTGWTAVVPWVMPALIGLPATVLWRRHYRRVFERPAAAHA